MPTYLYKAKKGPTQVEEGAIEAENQFLAANILEERGLFVVKIIEQPAKTKDNIFLKLGLFQGVGLSDLATFTRQLSSLLNSGLTLLAALNVVGQQTQNALLKKTIGSVADEVKDGKTFSAAMSLHPKIFSNLFSAIVHSGEASGSLNIVLEELADFSEKEEEIRARIKAALAYPVLITLVGFATIFVLLSFVIPKLIIMFEDLGQALPLPTRMLIGISKFFKGYWWVVIAVISILIFILRRQAKTPEGKFSLHRFALTLPLAGLLIRKMEISRFSRTLSMLLANGVAILPALEIVKHTLTNQVLKNETDILYAQIKDGASLASAVRKSVYFPLFVTNIIAVGEQAGLLEKSLMRVSVTYEREIDRIIKTMTTLLEPVMILIMGLIVGFIVISILLPIFQINLIAR